MPNNKEQFDAIASHLKQELSLQTDEEYLRNALNESYDIYKQLQIEYQKGLDEIELTETDLDMLDYIKGWLPSSFWILNDLNENLFVNTHLTSFRGYPYTYVDDFVKALCKDGWEGKEKDRLLEGPDEPGIEDDGDEEESDNDIDSVIKTIDTLQKGVYQDDHELAIEELFKEQTRQDKIKIIRHVLSGENTEYTPLWNYTLSEVWWDDELKPDLERWWRDKEAARVVVRRFPYEYVVEHHAELGQCDYDAVCKLFAKEKGFHIDKSRLSRIQYLQILADNHIHVEDDEADHLLFDHIMKWLLAVREMMSQGRPVDWSDLGMVTPIGMNSRDYQALLSQWFNYKPSLYEVPWTVRFTLNLCFMGNTNTVAKLIVWNQFLRANMQSYSEENEGSALKLDQVAAGLDDNIDRNWRRFIELAIETCPVGKEQIKDEFLDWE